MRAKFGPGAFVMGEPEQIDHTPAGFPLWQSLRDRNPGSGIFGTGKETVAVDRSGQCLKRRRRAWITWR